jgi:hypothetical protein
MRASVANRSTVAGTSLRAVASIFGTATKGFRLREVGVFNTTATACAVSLVRFTNATGVGAGITDIQWDKEHDPLPLATPFAGHTADGAVSAAFRQASLGAAVGSGVIWTFGDTGICVNIGTANGIGIITPTGTGQILDFYYDWEE